VFTVRSNEVISLSAFLINSILDNEAPYSETNDVDFSYKEVSDLSDATEDIQAESLADNDINDLDDYQNLVATT
jgi:hypothetical protein